MMITKDMTIQEIVSRYPQSLSVFERYGLSCWNCLAAEFESLESSAIVHRINLDDLLWDLNRLAYRE